MQEIFKGIFFSLIQGVAEFLPVSSSAHLYAAQMILKSSNFLEIKFFLECATFLVIAFYYQSFLLANCLLLFHHQRKKAVIFFVKIFLCTFPFLLYLPALKLFPLRSISFFLIMGGILMIVAEIFHKRKQADPLKPFIYCLEDVSFKKAFFIGAFQGLSIFSGFSRSGSAISGGLICGLSREFSVRFSFLIGLPIFFLSLVKDFYQLRPQLTLYNFFIFMICFITASRVIKPALLWVSRLNLTNFAIYRFFLATCLMIFYNF